MGDNATPIASSDIDSVFAKTTNLASSDLHTRVLACSNDYFASASNLLTPGPPVHKPGVFVETGAWYDGWETRRHNPNEYDWVVIKLGVGSGAIEGVEIDTAHFVGNYGEKVLVEGTYFPGQSAAVESVKHDAQVISPEYPNWRTILPSQPCGPSQRQAWKLARPTSAMNYLRIRMYPDGGFARLRLYGHVNPPHLPSSNSRLPVEELSSVLMGGLALSASDQHFTPCANLLNPGRGKDMGDGWETARSRAPGHVDWAIIKLGVPAKLVERVVVDTKDFKGNFPRAVRVHALYNSDGERDDDPDHDDKRWRELVLGERSCKADTEHNFDGQLVVHQGPFTHVKLTLVPDGGVKRLRIFGQREV